MIKRFVLPGVMGRLESSLRFGLKRVRRVSRWVRRILRGCHRGRRDASTLLPNRHHAGEHPGPHVGNSGSRATDRLPQSRTHETECSKSRMARNGLDRSVVGAGSEAKAGRNESISPPILERRNERLTLPSPPVFQSIAPARIAATRSAVTTQTIAHEIDVCVAVVSRPMLLEVVEKSVPIMGQVVLLKVLQRK